jgi:hypothetical protein
MKIFFIMLLGLYSSNFAFSQQNYQWINSNVSATTNGSVGIGTIPYDNYKLDLKFITFQNGVPPNAQITDTGGIRITNDNVSGVNSTLLKAEDLMFSLNNGMVRIPKFTLTSRYTHIHNRLFIGNLKATGAYADYALSVDGGIVAKKCVIQIKDWADYVFASDYSLKPLEEVEAFIEENKHLPDVPSEKMVLEEGIELAEMNKILLQKVEELTLYLIEQDKKIKALENRINNK